VCLGAGVALLSAQAAALLAAAADETCDQCAGLLDEDADTVDPRQIVCGVRAEGWREDAAACQAATSEAHLQPTAEHAVAAA
jgi:hypothetical protein